MAIQEEEEALLRFDSLPMLDDGWLAFASVEPPPNQTAESNRSVPGSTFDPGELDRRLRRKISNRESARRSRERKRRRVEELRGEEDKLRWENQVLAARLEAAKLHSLLFRRDNERLRWESAALRRRLAGGLVVLWTAADGRRRRIWN